MLTHDPAENPDHASITFLACGVREAVATAAKAGRREEDRDLRRQPRPSIAFQEGLIDEIYVHLLPHPANRTLRLPGEAPLDLETTSVTRAGQITNSDSAYSSNQSRDSRAGGRYPSLSLHFG